MFTSGTTGYPKGAMIQEENLIGNIRDICSYFKIDEKDKILISRPLHHSAVLTGEFLTSLVNGVHIRFFSGKFNPIQLYNIMEDNGITIFCCTPTIIKNIMLILGNKKPLKLKKIVISGECMSIIDAKSIRKYVGDIEIYSVYGLTEACPRVCYLEPELFDVLCGTVGRPVQSDKIKINTK